LISREFETETTQSVYLMLDISATMRAGQVGRSALDFAVDTSIEVAQHVLRSGGRVGLCSFDHEVFGFTRASRKPKTAHEIRAHVYELQSIVHENFTDVTREGLYERVGQYMHTQLGVRTQLPEWPNGMSLYSGWDEDLICSAAGNSLQQHTSKLNRLRRNFGNAAAAGDESVLRFYCRFNGIPLPYRTSIYDRVAIDGLQKAVTTCIGDRRMSHTLILISDLKNGFSLESLEPITRIIRVNKHRLTVMPVSIALPVSTDGSLEHKLAYAFQREQRHEQLKLMRCLQRQGIRSTGL